VRVRVHVWEKVLERDLVLFKGTKAKQTEDVAYRITAKASDVAHTMYAVLNYISVMVVKIVVISRILSGISAVACDPEEEEQASHAEKERELLRHFHEQSLRAKLKNVKKGTNWMLENLQFILGVFESFLLCKRFIPHGSVYKLAFGPKGFVVVSDPIVASHILRENAFGYNKVIVKEGRHLSSASWLLLREAAVDSENAVAAVNVSTWSTK
ncbi:hypothetical protein ABKV19_000193, partial [Rosa sericea]